jgi:hypothetical protein
LPFTLTLYAQERTGDFAFTSPACLKYIDARRNAPRALTIWPPLRQLLAMPSIPGVTPKTALVVEVLPLVAIAVDFFNAKVSVVICFSF